MSENLRVDDLVAPARTLAIATQSLQRLGLRAPEMPNAGPSTPVVGAFLASLAEAMSGLAASTGTAADRVQASALGYAETESGNAHAVAESGTL